MANVESKSSVQKYLDKFGIIPDNNLPSIPEDCSIIITIPCYKEEYLTDTLNSLLFCTPTKSFVEVLVMLNGRFTDAEETVQINNQTKLEFKKWKQEKASQFENIDFQLVEELNMPKKHGGVGLARKMVMDLACQRFDSINRNGVIVCFDADSTVSKNYLVEIEKNALAEEIMGGALYYEHDLSTAEGELREGMLYYELFLRYYIEGLRQAEYPNAFHTIGSSMFCKVDSYVKIGGMNKRKAGEDFYFIHKLIPVGKFIELNELKVIPSCRTSDRVPFGTGKAQQNWIDGDTSKELAYHPKIFSVLKEFIVALRKLNREQLKIQTPSIELESYLGWVEFDSILKETYDKTTNEESFQKRLWSWLDGFVVLKFVHYLRDNHFGELPIVDASNQLLGEKVVDLEKLLVKYRESDRSQK